VARDVRFMYFHMERISDCILDEDIIFTNPGIDRGVVNVKHD